MIECKGRIAVLTSGGDAPGMNAAVRAVVRTDRKSTRLNSSHRSQSRMPSSA